MKTETMTPTWGTAVQIYCAALRNPKAPEATKASAEADLLRLARMIDTRPTATPAIRFVVDVMLWRDDVNGNTYHAAQVTRTLDGERWNLSFSYGPESMALSRAIHALYGFGEIEDMSGDGLLTITRRGRKRETTAHGKGLFV